MLHVHCGDSPAETLRKSGAAGEVIVWCDPLCEGPTPAGLPDPEWRAVRARSIAESSGGALKPERVAEWLAKADASLDRCRDHDEAVLWFDACLFDQIILIRQLDAFAQRDMAGTRLSLICVGQFTGFEKFRGLGELDPGQMASLLDTRHEVAASETDLARQAWAAFRAPDPSNLEALTRKDTSDLPFLGEALVRHLEQFPSARNGLSRLQHEGLEVVAAGHARLGGIFEQVSDREERPFFGETMLWGCLDRMARAKAPLLAVAGPGRLPLWDAPEDLGAWTVTVTDAGREVLAGKQDWIELNGIDRWLGGAHLAGPEAAWRWDERGRELVRPDLA